MKIGFGYGILCEPLEKQANDQGFTISVNAEIFEKRRDAINLLRIGNVLTDSASDKCYQKLNKQIIKALKPLESTGKMTDTELKLLKSFPGSFINQNGEFIAHGRANEYFTIYDCNSDIEIKCKVLEWLSRAAIKTEPFSKRKKNNEFHEFMLCGINTFLDTDFSKEDMEQIYTKLGNGCNLPLCEKFVTSGYDMEVLR